VFWFASIKVVAIVAFILVAAGYVITGGGVEQLTAHGGFTPKGGVAMLSGVVIASMAFVSDVRSQLWLGLLSVAVVLGAYFVKSRRQHAGGDAGEGGLRVRHRRFSGREDRERDPSAVPLQ
jgi:hypothetical protein